MSIEHAPQITGWSKNLKTSLWMGLRGTTLCHKSAQSMKERARFQMEKSWQMGLIFLSLATAGAACFGRCVYQYRHEMSARERAWVKKIQEEDRLMEKDMDEIEDDTVAIEQAQAAVAQSIESLSREMDISNARIERAEKLIVGMSTSAKAGRMSASERLKEKGAAMKRTTAELAASRKSARADCSSPVSAIVPDDPDSTTPSHVVKYERESFGEEPRSVQSTPTKKSMEDAVMANEWTSEWNDTCEWGYHNSTGPTK